MEGGEDGEHPHHMAQGGVGERQLGLMMMLQPGASWLCLKMLVGAVSSPGNEEGVDDDEDQKNRKWNLISHKSKNIKLKNYEVWIPR